QFNVTKIWREGQSGPVLLIAHVLVFLNFFLPAFRPATCMRTSGIMDALTGAAASGLRARMESLDMLANNLANTETGGYKIDREFYSLYVAPEAAGADAPTTMPVIEKAWTDFSQGT